MREARVSTSGSPASTTSPVYGPINELHTEDRDGGCDNERDFLQHRSAPARGTRLSVGSARCAAFSPPSAHERGRAPPLDHSIDGLPCGLQSRRGNVAMVGMAVPDISSILGSSTGCLGPGCDHPADIIEIGQPLPPPRAAAEGA